jgi:hypothetical protein
MPPSTDSRTPALPRHPGRAARLAWRTGWVVLALVSMAIAYAALVYAGR